MNVLWMKVYSRAVYNLIKGYNTDRAISGAMAPMSFRGGLFQETVLATFQETVLATFQETVLATLGPHTLSRRPRLTRI